MPFLKQLLAAPGISGYEAPVRSLIEEAWKPLTDSLKTSRLGSLYGLKKSTSSPRPEVCPSILLAAHMDAVGLMVSSLAGEYLRVTQIGGLDWRVLPGQTVIIHGGEDIPGIIVAPPDHLLPDALQGKAPALEHLLVETGLLARRVSRLVKPGDLISFAQQPIEMGEDYLVGHSLDDRASVAALTYCLDLLQSRIHAWDVWAVATVQEEVTQAGAITSAFEMNPDIAIAIDVTFAKGANDGNNIRTYPLGEGIAIGWGPNIHPAVFKMLKDLSEKYEIPHDMEPLPNSSGTDAIGLQIARAGIPTAVISIPLRYMHTVVEMVSLKDILRAGRLMTELVTALTPATIQEMVWEE
jgi:putative aminopeptidase FrvX